MPSSIKRTKLLYIVSNVDKAIAFEWIIEEFKKLDFELVFVLLNDNTKTTIVQFLKLNHIKYYTIQIKSKLNFPIIILNLMRIIHKEKPKVVHTHLLEASLLGLFAAKLMRVKKRIQTRHHSTSQHEYFPNAVKFDKLNNLLSTKIIAISNNVKNVLIRLENVPENKIELIEHGFRLEQFRNEDRLKVNNLKEKHKIPEGKIIIATISRYLKLKGVIYVIRAFKKFHQINNNAHLLLANSNGNYKAEVKNELKNLPDGSYTEITFEPDLFNLYHLIDIYCHVPINNTVEAFGQTYVESLAAGVPSIFTKSGIANDFIKHNENAFVVGFKNSEEILQGLVKINNDLDFKNQLIINGYKSVERFSLSSMITKLEHLYISEN